MTRKLRRNYSLSVVVPFVAVLIMAVGFAALAQTTGSGQRPVLLTQQDTNALPLQTLNRLLLPRASNIGRTTGSPLRKNKPVAGPKDGSPSLFLPTVAYETGGADTFAVAVADVNGDGKPDLVVANECADPNCGSSSIGVLLGNGDGTFQPVVIGGSAGWLANAMAVADLNGDRKPDVVVTNWLSNEVSVLVGNGDGTFQSPVSYDSGGIDAETVVIGDVNGDGIADLVVGNGAGPGASYNSVAVLLGNGDGTFQAANTYYTTGSDDVSVALADLNGDGKPDLAVVNVCAYYSNCEYGSVVVLLGNGDGTFGSPVIYGSGADDPASVAVGDVNGDGKPDLLIANGSGTVGVLLGNGDGTFQPAATYNSGGGGSIRVADVNGDGKLDLLMVAGSSVFVMLGNGDGSFQAPLTFDSGGTYAASLAVADVNDDGRPDLLVANGSGMVGVLLNNSAPTSTSLTSSLDPSTFGQVVTFTAVVSSTAGVPPGKVVFSDGSMELGSATLVNGSASISISSLAAGSHSITAAYQGFSGFVPSTSAPLNQVVNTEATTTSLASSMNPVLTGESVAYTATVASQCGGALTGTVAFQDGGSTVATVPIVGGQAGYTTKYKVAGAHAITATYSGDTNNTGSVSPPLVEQINKGFTSEVAVTTSGSPSLVGQPVTFTAAVTSKHGAIPDGEQVTFSDGNIAIGTGSTASGIATFTTSSLSIKTHTIKATYPGDGTFKPSSGLVKQVVDKYPTTTALSSSPNPSQSGQAVTFSATVTSAGPTPTGKVKFMDGAKALGSRTLTGGVASLTTSKLAVGTHPITAQYLGDADNAESTSPVLDQVVQ